MIFGSVCSGIEAASVAWGPLGWKAAFFSEIEKYPKALLKHYYPEVPDLGDMTKFREWPDYAIDLLAGGTPCQGFSIAGLRAGLDDPRSKLSLGYCEIAARYRPRWLVWENVPGVLSSNNGHDFGSFLGLLCGRQIPVPSGGWQSSGIIPGTANAYGLCYRVLDAQYAGLAQRRRRVFVVGYLGDWRRAAAVLLELEGLSWNPAPRREAGKGFTHDVAPCLDASGVGFARTGDIRGQDPVIAGTLNANGKAAGSATQQDAESGLLIAAGGNNSNLIDVAATLQANGGQRNNFAHDTFIFDTTQITSPNNRSNPKPGDPCHTLAAGADAPAIVHTPPLAFDSKASGQHGFGVGEISPTLRAMEGERQNGGGQVAVAIQERAVCENPAAGPDGSGFKDDGTSYTLEARSVPQAVAHGFHVRRLTPRECERLQGFPDDYTLVPFRGKPASDGPRYRALGNSWPVPVVRWIGERIQMVEDECLKNMG